MRHILDIIRTLFKDITIKEAYFIYFNNSQIHHFFITFILSCESWTFEHIKFFLIKIKDIKNNKYNKILP